MATPYAPDTSRKEGMESFEGGVVYSLPTQELPNNMIPVGFNTAYINTPGGNRVLGKRPGYLYKNTLGSASGSYATGQSFFFHDDTGVVATHHIAVSNTGYIYDIHGTTTNIPLPTANGEFPDATLDGTSWRFAAANNALFGVSGSQAFKVYKKTGVNTVYAAPIGIAAPSAAPTQGTLAAGAMTGDYDFLVTWYNEYTSTESARSAALSLTLTSQNAVLNLAGLAAPAAEVTKIRVYVRKQSLGPGYYRSAAMEYAYTTSSVTLDLTDAAINNMTLTPPDIGDYDVLPPNIIDISWHLSRMFATDGKSLYYSQIGNPEQYNLLNYEFVNPQDGQKIIALHSVNQSTLLVLKERSAYLLVGSTSTEWEVRLLTNSVGCVSKRSVVEGDGVVTWWSHQGPVLWTKAGEPQFISDATIIPLARENQIYLNSADDCKVAHDPVNHRFLYSLKVVAGNTFDDGKWTVAPYSILTGSWEALAWDLGTIHSFCTGPSSAGEYRVFWGAPEKYVFELTDSVKTDAAQNTTGANLYFTMASCTTTAATFTSAVSVPVSAYNAYARIIDIGTMIVTRVTGTVSGGGSTKTFTFSTALASAPTVDSLITFDLPVVEFRTPNFTHGQPYDKKRYLFTYLRYATTGDTPAVVGVFTNNSQTPKRVWQPVLSTASLVAFDQTTPPTVAGAAGQFDGRIATVGEEIQARFIGYYPQTTWWVTSLHVSAVMHYVR